MYCAYHIFRSRDIRGMKRVNGFDEYAVNVEKDGIKGNRELQARSPPDNRGLHRKALSLLINSKVEHRVAPCAQIYYIQNRQIESLVTLFVTIRTCSGRSVTVVLTLSGTGVQWLPLKRRPQWRSVLRHR